ncbi:MAG: TRAP transporter large permease, partial [Alphaproteobacteria bacterium]
RYTPGYAAAVTAASAVIGPIIPPSIPMVLYALISDASIGYLFLGGIVPGLLIAAGLLVICWVHAKRADVPRLPRASAADVARAFADGRWALASPLVVLGGIYGGIFTPTEAAAVSCLYAIIIGLFVERKLSLRALPGIFVRAMRTSAIVCGIIAVSAGFGILVAQEQIAIRFATWMAQAIGEKWAALATLNIAFFLLAAVMDEIAIMVILGPMLIAIANRFGVDPIHFGAIIVTNVSIGMAAPPIGYCLFIGMAISGLSLARISRAIWPQILWMLVVLFLTTYVPSFALMFQPSGR